MSNTVLIVENEEKISSVLKDCFKTAGFDVHVIDNGLEVLPWVEKNHPVAITLNLMLPGKPGLDLCKEIRDISNVPLLIASDNTDEIDRLLGLELGADDFICKPFSSREVVARVKAVLRRGSIGEKVEHGNGFRLDEDRLSFGYQGQEVALTNVEFRLLKPLMSKPGRIFTREELMEAMYSDDRIVSSRTIDSHVKKLRIKLARLRTGKELIQSVYATGYRAVLA